MAGPRGKDRDRPSSGGSRGDRQRNDIARKVSAMLERAAKNMEKARTTAAAFDRMSAVLNRHTAKLSERYPDRYGGELIEELAADADELRGALDGFGPGPEDEVRLKAAAISDSMMTLGGAMAAFAGSFRDPEDAASSPVPAPAELRDAAAALVFDFHDAALALRRAAGLPAPHAVVVPRPTSPGRCCGARRPVEPAFDPPPPPTVLTPYGYPIDTEVDWPRVEAALEWLARILAALIALLLLMAGYFLLLAGLGSEWYHILCSDDCGGPSGAVIGFTVTGHRGQIAGGGAYQGYVDFDIDICCANRCIGVMMEWDVETVQKSIPVGNPANNQGAAIRVARRGGAAEARRYIRQTKLPAARRLPKYRTASIPPCP